MVTSPVPLCRCVSKPRNIAQIPDLPALAEVGDVLSAELGYQSLGKQLDRLAPLLKDESTEVCRRFFLWVFLVGGGAGPLTYLVSMDSKGRWKLVRTSRVVFY